MGAGKRGRPSAPPLRASQTIARRAGEGIRPYGGKQNRSVGSEQAGAELEPHRLKFLHTQGPVGRNEPQTTTQILRAGNILPGPRGNPRNGGPGVRRIWTRSVHPEPSPGDPLGTFPSLGKYLAARRRRNLPAKKRNRSIIAPQGETLCRSRRRFIIAPSSGPSGHLPPRGKAEKVQAAKSPAR